uniref:Uncharacterized protein n=1 Tax=Setaria italica TaxID=4555 RepID=K3XTS0_SETIT
MQLIPHLMLKSCMGSGRSGALLSVQCWRMRLRSKKRV